MRRLAALLVVLGALAPLALPAGATATIVRPIALQQFKGSIRGESTVTWTRRAGPVGATCQSWLSQNGTVKTTFRSSRTGIPVTILGDARAIGSAPLKGALSGTAKTTEGFLAEPGCPVLCADATGARPAPPGGPFAWTADCEKNVQRRVTNTSPCSDAKPLIVLAFKGSSEVRAEIQSGENPKRIKPLCTKPPGDPAAPVLFEISDLQSLGPRGKLLVQKTAKGDCPNAPATEDGGATKITCRYTLRLKLTLRRR